MCYNLLALSLCRHGETSNPDLAVKDHINNVNSGLQWIYGSKCRVEICPVNYVCCKLCLCLTCLFFHCSMFGANETEVQC